ncbi:MAG: polymer-forming cytoskeletal protein [Dehalococcoidia bacterium]|nr:polymer-forming cytoskeletal protein [Dehalococcoidia bacterium]
MFAKAGRFLALLAAVLTIIILLTVPAAAADIRQGQTLVIPAEEVVNDDLYLFGSGITIDGTVNGDVIAFGDHIAVNGPVNGNINGAANYIVIKGKVGDSVRAAASTIDVDSNIGGDLVAAASLINILPDGAVGRDVLPAAGTVNIDGPVGKDIRGSAGDLVIDSSVGGNVYIECNTLQLGPSAGISGDLIYKSEKDAVQADGARVNGKIDHIVPPPPESSTTGKAAGRMAGWAASAIVIFIVILLIIIALFKYIAALLTGIIFILLARKYIPGLIVPLKSKPWPCLGYGALFFLLVPIAIFIAFLLVIGIPLGLIGLAVYILAIYLASIFIALFLGKWMLRQSTDITAVGPNIGALALGLLVLYIVSIIPLIGCLCDLAAILFGLGAFILFIRSKAGCNAA